MDLESEHDLLVRRRIEESIAAKCALLQDRELIRLVVDVAQLWTSALRGGCTIFLFGNGGSAADAEHIATELVGRYQRHRPGLRAMALTANTAGVSRPHRTYPVRDCRTGDVRSVAAFGTEVAPSPSGYWPLIERQ